MSYFIICTFDLSHADANDYEEAYKELGKIGLSRELTADNGNVITLPTTTTVGKFEGDRTNELRDKIMNKIKNSFNNKGFKSEIFVSVSGNWAWSYGKT